MTSIVNSVVQKCAPTASINQVISAIQQNCENAEINISHIKMRAFASMNVACAQEAASSATTKTSVEQVAKQMAEAISQALSLNPGSTKAQNILNMSMNVSTSILNSTEQIIAAATAASQRIEVRQSDGTKCVANISFVDMDAMLENVARGIQKSKQVSEAVTALRQEADQSAKAKQSSLILLIILAIIIALGIVGGPAVKPLIYVGVPVIGVLTGWRWYLDKKYAQQEKK